MMVARCHECPWVFEDRLGDVELLMDNVKFHFIDTKHEVRIDEES